MIGTLALLCLFQLDIRTNLKLVLYSHHTNLNLCGLSLTGIHFNLKSPKAPSADAMEHIGSCITQLEQAYSSKDFVNATSIRISKARIFMHSTFLLYRAVRSTEECSAALAQDDDKPKRACVNNVQSLIRVPRGVRSLLIDQLRL